MPFEVEGDGEAGSVIAEGIHADIDHGPDRSVDSPYAPGPWRVDVGDLGGHRSVGEADAALQVIVQADE